MRFNFPKPPSPRIYLTKRRVLPKYRKRSGHQCWRRAAEKIQSNEAVEADPTEENFWGGVVLAYYGVRLKTYSGLPFTYEIRKGGMDNTQKNCGLTDVGKARAWRGVLCYWHWGRLKRWEK